jgi:hypothetical protein
VENGVLFVCKPEEFDAAKLENREPRCIGFRREYLVEAKGDRLEEMQTDKGQFDAVLSRMLKSPPKKESEIRAKKSQAGCPTQASFAWVGTSPLVAPREGSSSRLSLLQFGSYRDLPTRYR